MAEYTPNTTFDFTADPTYTPGGDFNFNTAPDLVGNIVASTEDAVAAVVGHIAVRGDVVAVTQDASASITAYLAVIGDVFATTENSVADFAGNNALNLGNIIASTDNAVAGFVGHYDPNIHRFITSLHKAPINDASNLPPALTCFSQQQGSRLDHHVMDQQLDGILVSGKIALVTEKATVINISHCLAYEDAILLLSKTALVREQGAFVDLAVHINQEQATYIAGRLCAVMQQMTKVYPDKWQLIYQDSSVFQHDFLHLVHPDLGGGLDYTPDDGDMLDFNPVDTGYAPSDEFNFTFKTHDYNAVGHSVGVASSTIHASFQIATRLEIQQCVPVEMARHPPRGKSVWVDLPRPDPPNTPPTGTTYTVPTQEVYTMQHTISVTLEDLTAIKMDNLSMKYDADSFAWQFSGNLLDHDQLPLVKPLANGSAIKLIVTINGYVWHVLADLISHKREFGKRSIGVTGRGTSALLAAPNEQSTSGTQGSLLTIVQIAQLHVPVGWTLDWQAVTWNISAGAYSWQDRTPLQAIADIAAAAGAIVVPSRDSQTLTVKPRYPVLPWDFAGTPVDVAIADAAILELTHRQASQKHPNGVYVHGSEIGGVLGWSRLNGTAGDVLMQTQSNALMTDVIGLRAISERLLAGQYTQPEISSIKTAMDGTIIPLIEVGSFVGITVDGVETKAVVSGVEISATVAGINSPADVEQAITLGEETSNQWVAFRSLLPKDPLLVGTITSTTGTTSIISLIDGGVVNVRGTGTVNDKVYIRSGQIQGDAPNMVQNDIVI